MLAIKASVFIAPPSKNISRTVSFIHRGLSSPASYPVIVERVFFPIASAPFLWGGGGKLRQVQYNIQRYLVLNGLGGPKPLCFSLPAYGHPQQIADVCNHAEAANEMTMMESIDVRWISSRLTGVRGEKARLAEALCISPDQVAKMLAGVRRVQPKEIPKLLEFFGEDRLLVTPAERRLVELYRLAPEGRREAVEILLSVPPSPQKTP